MIPKIIYFHHTGPLSYLRYLSIESAAKINPDYTIIYHHGPAIYKKFATGEHQEYYTGPDYTNNLSYLANVVIKGKDCDLPTVQASDYMRWDFLLTGGIWADDDIIFFDKIGKYIPQCATICVYEVPPHGWTIGLMAAAPGSAIIKDIIAARNKISTDRYQGFGAELLSGIGKSCDELQRLYPTEKVYNFPRKTIFLEIGDSKCQNLYKPDKYDPSVFNDMLGLHWYGGQPGALAVQTNPPARSAIAYAIDKYRSQL
jgi:hypothetical protein